MFSLIMKKNKRRGLEVGSPIPDVWAFDPEGNPMSVRELCSKGLVLLYFFPKANTPGCTIQACNLRDHLADLQKANVRVVGISRDKPSVQKKFIQNNRLNLMLLCDPSGEVCKEFAIPLFFGMPKRLSFLIKDGKVLWRDCHPNIWNTAAEVLEALKASNFWLKD